MSHPLLLVLLLFALFGVYTPIADPTPNRTTDPNPIVTVEESGCEILIYATLTDPPLRQRDTRGTCPDGNGARAYVLSTPENVGHFYHQASLQGAQRPQLKEVAPDSSQHFSCLSNQKCYIVVRGYSVGYHDAVAILPLGQTTCPPTDLAPASNTDREPASSLATVVVAQSERIASLSSTRLAVPEASFTAFEIPVELSSGSYTVCYSPILSSEASGIDSLQARSFHYTAGILEVGEALLNCSFEEATRGLPQGDAADAILPCGFKNFRNRFDVNLVWQLGQDGTDTAGTGPNGDATQGLDGHGHYIYMDSPGYALGAPAVLVSTPIAYPGGMYCTEFSYNMHGEDVSTLRAYIHEVELTPMKDGAATSSVLEGNPLTTTVTTLLGNWGSPRWVAVGNKGEKWHRAGLEFKAASMQTFQLAFEALAGKSEYGDIAIDEVTVKPGRCSPEVRHHFPKTLGRRDEPLICGEVRLVTGEDSVDKSWYVDGAISCSGRGYSIDQMRKATWLPCCVPHLGSYKLVLEDQFGDGWTGSYLEFLFFDRLMTFGKEDAFQKIGFDQTYTLVIGLVEILGVRKVPSRDGVVDIDVRVAQRNAYVWCGAVKAGKDGKVLKVKLTPEVLSTYGVRSSSPTTKANEVVHLEIKNILKDNSKYDVYCHSEVVGGSLKQDDSNSTSVKTKQQQEEEMTQQILGSRRRISTDSQPPTLSHLSVVAASADSVTVVMTVDEPATIWCVSIRVVGQQFAEGNTSDALFGSRGPLEGLAVAASHGATSPDAVQRLARYFQQDGTLASALAKQDAVSAVAIAGEHVSPRPEQHQLTFDALVPNWEYAIYCYAEDDAEPEPNRMSAEDVKAGQLTVRTLAKVPSIRIARRQTLHRGFKLYVVADAPGKAWCAAAPADYGIPNVAEVVRVGAAADIQDPGKEVPLEVRGVEPNTPYVIYCVGGKSSEEGDAQHAVQEYSDEEEMVSRSVSLVSYGKHCEEGENVEIMKTAADNTPFHPVTTEEEMRVRNYIMSIPELGLEGVYRITLLPNKTEIKDFYAGKGPKPLRYARVRAGHCVNGVGIYEQLRVGPLDGPRPLSYTRVSQPIETDCGGYNPQGVFGRRLSEARDSVSMDKLSQWTKKSFGYEYGIHKCRVERMDEYLVKGVSAAWSLDDVSTVSSRRRHAHDRQCLEVGPVIVEEACDQDNGHTACLSTQRYGRVWVGLKTPQGDSLPIYFIYRLPNSEHKPRDHEAAEDWVRRIIRDKELPGEFHEIWDYTELWVEGRTFKSIEDFLDSVRKGDAPEFQPGVHEARQKLKATQLMTETRRRLQPQPYPGAAGTAGPQPARLSRRQGLEFRAHPEHVESQGKRFQVESSSDEEEYTITYAGWNMTVTNDRDTALRVYHISFQGQSVAFEMGLMEALAHYTVSERNWFFLDSWYGGLGAAARKVHKGIECPKTAVSLFWDGSLCVFEQDMARPTRVHWRGGEIKDGAPHTTLVLRQMLTVSNYDYVTDYRFHLTGIFEASISFTGELYAGIEVPWYSARQAEYGVQVTGALRFAALHSHMAVWKIDLDVGPADSYKENSVYLTEVIPDPSRPGANKLKRTFAETESDAIYFRNDSRALVYEVVDEKIRIFGNVGGWRVVAFPGINPLHHDFELYTGPAAWAKYRIFTSVHKYGEMDSTLPRDNKYAKRPATAVDRYLEDNEPLRRTDVVTWISDGIFHVPVIEDIPLTVPVGNTLGWMIKPANLFLEDPSMDLSNAMGGGVQDPGTCAVVRVGIGEVEPTLAGTWDGFSGNRNSRY